MRGKMAIVNEHSALLILHLLQLLLYFSVHFPAYYISTPYGPYTTMVNQMNAAE